MKKLGYYTVLAFAIVFSGCNSDGDGAIKGNQEKDKTPGISNIIGFTPEERQVNDSLNVFGFKLINEVAKDREVLKHNDKNIALSPLSASVALGMLANTENVEMREAVVKILGQGNLFELNAACDKLMCFLPSRRNGGELSLANSAWFNNGYLPGKEWSDALASYYYAEVNQLDFTDKASVDKINAWVSNKTNGLVKKVKGYISPYTKYILINTLYFLGQWEKTFDKDLTFREPFKGVDMSTEVDMMHDFSINSYVEMAGYKMTTRKFDGDTRMVLILPDAGRDLMEFVATFSYEDYNKALAASRLYKVNLSLPKFKLDTNLDISEYMEALGLPITATDRMGNITSNLSVEQFTNTFIDEEGARLAAATVIEEDIFNEVPEIMGEVAMELNRPFMYLIQNTRIGTVLMAGIVNNL